MGKTVSVELNTAGIGALLKGSETQKMVSDMGADIARRAGSGYAVRVHDSGQRQIANVYAESSDAKQDNSQNNTLLKEFHI